jgi:hypothetical protein
MEWYKYATHVKYASCFTRICTPTAPQAGIEAKLLMVFSLLDKACFRFDTVPPIWFRYRF